MSDYGGGYNDGYQVGLIEGQSRARTEYVYEDAKEGEDVDLATLLVAKILSPIMFPFIVAGFAGWVYPTIALASLNVTSNLFVLLLYVSAVAVGNVIAVKMALQHLPIAVSTILGGAGGAAMCYKLSIFDPVQLKAMAVFAISGVIFTFCVAHSMAKDARKQKSGGPENNQT